MARGWQGADPGVEWRVFKKGEPPVVSPPSPELPTVKASWKGDGLFSPASLAELNGALYLSNLKRGKGSEGRVKNNKSTTENTYWGQAEVWVHLLALGSRCALGVSPQGSESCNDL